MLSNLIAELFFALYYLKLDIIKKPENKMFSGFFNKLTKA